MGPLAHTAARDEGRTNELLAKADGIQELSCNQNRSVAAIKDHVELSREFTDNSGSVADKGHERGNRYQ
jgi:hypothetical protein